MPTYRDPTTVRLSDQFLLSDFLLCDSVARYGYSNQFDTDDENKLREARELTTALEFLMLQFGPVNISYGYISPELSRKIVKYQDPNKPSYHRYELGAAADIRFPNVLKDNAPIQIAWEIDAFAEDFTTAEDEWPFSYSRMITYSESEWICFATSLQTRSRVAFYENRYIPDEPKPKYITYPTSNRRAFIEKQPVPTDWRGQGFPRYHGGGRLQFQHRPVSKHTTYLDFLYSKHKVHTGEKNLPPLAGSQRVVTAWEQEAAAAGIVMDALIEEFNCHFSIVSAYNSTSEGSSNWLDGFRLVIVPPTFLDAEDVAHFADDCIFECKKVEVKNGKLYISGYSPEGK